MSDTFYQTDTSDMLIPHNMLRSALASANGIFEESTGDTERVAAIGSYFDNILRFLDVHHEGEDLLLWPVLAKRATSEAGLIASMQAEHKAIEERRDEAGSALDAWLRSPGPDTARRTKGALEGLRVTLNAHLSHEETDLLPVASRYISPEEWAALPGHAMAHFTGDKMWLILGLILEQMTPEQRAAVLKLLPQPAAEMWATSGNAAFDDFIARVRG
ncbi:MAG TPA: hemerythrin domain-containing protein [Acidimicrobiales bacterium]|nr:hemerythrin domain-containing protein [Acidimicrobiales bacterium]